MPLFYAAVVAASFFYGYLRLASGSLWPASIAHAVHNSAWSLMVAFTATSSPVLVNNYLLGDSGILITVAAAAGAVLVSRMMPQDDHKARHDATPPGARTGYPDRNCPFQAGLVMPQATSRPRPALRRWKPRRHVPALLLLTVALCMVPPVPSYADPPPAASPDFVAIEAYLDREMRDVRIPGLALGIVHKDEIAHLQGFGVADASGRVVTPQTEDGTVDSCRRRC